MRLLSRGFLQGLRVFLPIAITFSLIYWAAAVVESLMGRWIKMLLPGSLTWVYWRGAGVVLSLLAILLLGFLLYLPPVRALFALLEKFIGTLPGVRGIYGPCRDLIHYLLDGERGSKRFSKVVMVPLEDGKIKLLGLITQEDPKRLPEGAHPKKGEVLVFLPMSYQLGGYTVMVPRSVLEPVEMTPEEALRFAMLGGVSPCG